MISRAFITAWRSHVPWVDDAQVEQDLVLSRALAEIYSDPLLTEELAFRGGTALHKLFFKPAGRYSEDIDLVQVRAGPIGAIIDALRARLDPWLGSPQRKQGHGRVTLIYRFMSEIPPTEPLRLKVEINTPQTVDPFSGREALLADLAVEIRHFIEAGKGPTNQVVNSPF